MQYTISEIIHLTGIPENKATEVCNLLCSEGYLVYDNKSGKYSLTDQRDLLAIVRRVREQLRVDQKQVQIYDKIEDIIALGKPLALSDKERSKTIRDIGIPGLNIIFSGLQREDTQPEVSGEAAKVPGLPRGHCLLIKGAPGTGKTTMGVQIALHLRKYRSLFLTFEEEVDQLLVDLAPYCREKSSKEPPSKNIGWEEEDIRKITRSLRKFLTPSAWENADLMLQELCGIFDRELPQLVVIDSISRFKEIGGDDKAMQIMRRLIRTLKIRGITSIFLGEEKGEPNSFEEYQVDGIIRLEWVGDQLSLSVAKLRGIKAYKGPHSAALLTVDDFSKDKHKPEHRLITASDSAAEPNKLQIQPGLNVFPNISVFKDFFTPEIVDETGSEKPLHTGIDGLNRLLPLKGEEGGFKKGENIILIGSAGSGKTLLALSFMLQGYKEYGRPESQKGGKKIAVWLNLEGNIGTLRSAIDGFEKDEGSFGERLHDMVESVDNDAEKSYFKFFSFPPINLDLNKILYLLAALHKKYKIDRLVIDSITELERAKSGAQPEVKVFLAGLIQFLRDRKITTMFICRSDTFFRSIDKIEEQVLSLVDLIICIRNFDMRNQIHKGIYIQKARGRDHNSRIMRMTIDSREGIDIEDSGWDVEYLLAGDTSNIQPPRVFFKLFYENPAEEFINDAIIKDFDIDRYPGDEPIFRGVRKSSIHTEFWSFRGQYSAGHANTRVLSIADHVISAFRDNKRLTELKHYVKGELIKNMEDDPYLRRLFDLDSQSEKKEQEAIKEDKDTSEETLDLKYKIDAIPSYRDFGVMVYRSPVSQENSKPEADDQPDSTVQQGKESRGEGEGRSQKLPGYLQYLERFSKTPKAMHNEYIEDAVWLGKEEKGEFKEAYTWQNMVEWIKKYKGGSNGNDNIPKYAFAFPPLDNKSEFIAFFMELLWSFGGDIYDIPIYEKYSIANYRRRSKEIIRSRILFDLQECTDILEDKFQKRESETDEDKKKRFEDFRKSLEQKEEKIYKLLKKKFKKYGIAQERDIFGDFMSWIVKISNDEKSYACETPNPVMNWNSPSFKATINLIFKLIYEAKVINPIHGDYRKDSVLSRHWYSHLCIDEMKMELKEKKDREEGCPAADLPHKKMDHEKEDNFEKKLLPLPLAEIAINQNHSYYRSVSCHTYWCLVMLKDALSPEIGGNFIESLLASEYYKNRLKMKAGMPVVNLELSKKEYIDISPDAYALMKRIADNGMVHEELNSELSKNRKGSGNDIKEILKKNDHAYVRFDLLQKINPKEKLEEISSDDKVKKSLSKRMFYPKYRQTRVGFYHIEQALHQRIREILMIEMKKGKPQSLGEMQYLLAEHLEEERQCKKEIETLDDFILEKVINEFRLHAILEVLVSFYWEEEEEK